MLSLDIIKDRNSAAIYEYLFSYQAPFGLMKNLFGISDGKLLIFNHNNIKSI